jgi:hypothetical protein
MKYNFLNDESDKFQEKNTPAQVFGEETNFSFDELEKDADTLEFETNDTEIFDNKKKSGFKIFLVASIVLLLSVGGFYTYKYLDFSGETETSPDYVEDITSPENSDENTSEIAEKKNIKKTKPTVSSLSSTQKQLAEVRSNQLQTTNIFLKPNIKNVFLEQVYAAKNFIYYKLNAKNRTAIANFQKNFPRKSLLLETTKFKGIRQLYKFPMENIKKQNFSSIQNINDVEMLLKNTAKKYGLSVKELKKEQKLSSGFPIFVDFNGKKENIRKFLTEINSNLSNVSLLKFNISTTNGTNYKLSARFLVI